MRIMITACLLCALLTGCRSGKENQEEYDAVHPDVAGSAVPRGSMDTVRGGQQVRVYQTGRYVDPNNPNLMHEASTLYVLADSGVWNTSPNYAPLDPRHNRSITVSAPLTAEKQLEIQELRKTNEIMRRLGNELIRTKERLKESLERTNTLEKCIVEQGDALQKKIEEYEARNKLQAKRLSELELKLESNRGFRNRQIK